MDKHTAATAPSQSDTACVPALLRQVPAEEFEGEAAAEAAGLFSVREVRGELERLRADLDAASAKPAKVVAGGLGPCALPAGVPELAAAVRTGSGRTVCRSRKKRDLVCSRIWCKAEEAVLQSHNAT
jgi:hypothetical protein